MSRRQEAMPRGTTTTLSLGLAAMTEPKETPCNNGTSVLRIRVLLAEDSFWFVVANIRTSCCLGDTSLLQIMLLGYFQSHLWDRVLCEKHTLITRAWRPQFGTRGMPCFHEWSSTCRNVTVHHTYLPTL
ncbi:hypothetical protein BD309DRAFT_973529 [Dichomitus squalens]|nr:hypothetical protein BD309DRAFT_973529 [Dichomitus squalens]